MASDYLSQLVYGLRLILVEIALHGLYGLLFKFQFCSLCDLSCTHLLGALRLPSIMLGLDMRIKSRIGEIALAASTLKISPFLVFSGSSGSAFFALCQLNRIIRFFLHYYNSIGYIKSFNYISRHSLYSKESFSFLKKSIGIYKSKIFPTKLVPFL